MSQVQSTCINVQSACLNVRRREAGIGNCTRVGSGEYHCTNHKLVQESLLGRWQLGGQGWPGIKETH